MSQLKIKQVGGLREELDSLVSTAQNLGSSGVGLFQTKSGNVLQFNKLDAGTGIAALSISSNVVTIAVDVGAGPNKIVQLDASGYIPAINGSLLTNLTAANITGTRSLNLGVLDLPNGQFYVGGASNYPVTTPKSSIPLSGFGVPTTDINISSFKIYTSATSFASNELVTKAYVDQIAQGSSTKPAALCAAPGNINISAPGTNIDGLSPAIDTRILLFNQTDKAQNGVWLYKGSGSPMIRAADCDSEAELLWMEIYISDGTYSGFTYKLLTGSPITVGTTLLTYTQTGGGTTYTAGNGLGKTGAQFYVDPDAETIGIVNGKVTVRSTVTSGQVLRSTGAAGQAATWGALDLSVAAAVTGILPVLKGGTGLDTIAQHSIIGAISAANSFSTLLLSTNSVVGRKSGNLVALGKSDLREITNLRPALETANAVSGNMTLIALANTPESADQVMIFFNGVLLRYSTDYTISGQNVLATNSFNALMGGTGSDGLGFAATDRLFAFYLY